jgi:hypothetical protein
LNNAASVCATTFGTDFTAKIRTWISTRRSAYQASWRKSTNVGSLVA